MKCPKATTAFLFIFSILFSLKNFAQIPESISTVSVIDSASATTKTGTVIFAKNDTVTKIVIDAKAPFTKPLLKNFLSAKSIIAPSVFIGYGFTSLGHNQLNQLNKQISEEVVEDSKFKTRADDYLKYAPTAGVYVLDALGIKARHKFVDRTIVLVMSTILSEQIVTALKHNTHQLRPDGSTYNSFPSGHTTTAFIGAELMNQEYGSRSAWYSIAGYTVATATATMRIMNNRHWLGDVIAGAGLGILSTKFSYWLYYKIKPKITRQKAIY
jgi:hypothetical protein